MNRWRMGEPVDISSWRTRGLVIAVAAVGALIGTSAYSSFLRPPPASVRPYGYAQGNLRAALGHERGVRVLLVGNSLTAFNNLAAMVTRLTAATPGMPTPVFAVTWVPGGSTLGEAQANPTFQKLLKATRWNLVVMQEQTGLASVPAGEVQVMDSEVASLGDQARRAGAIPILFETWGNQTGTDALPYADEQARITANYEIVGADQHMDVAPVGEAWAMALSRRPSLAFWAADGHHPAPRGSYLAASVISACLSYALSHHHSAADPEPSSYTAGIEPRVALWLRQIAWATIIQSQCHQSTTTP